MAIAILNSDVHFEHNIDSESDEHSSSSSSSSSSESWEHGQGPCYAHFDTRYAVGTHAAGWDEIKKFSSSAAHGFYVRFLDTWYVCTIYNLDKICREFILPQYLDLSLI